MALLLSIGEILIDLTQVGVTEAGIPKFVANPGGAPANAAVAAAKMGAAIGFIGCVGRDAPTTLAVVSVDQAKERLRAILRFANCAASITTSRPGAIPAMPTLKEVTDKLNMEAEK